MWPVFWFARCKFYAQLGSNQPKKWQNRQKMSKNGHFMAIFWPYGLGYGAETQTTVISIGTHDLVRFWTLSDAWKYHLLRTPTLVWPGASEAPAPLNSSILVILFWFLISKRLSIHPCGTTVAIQHVWTGWYWRKIKRDILFITPILFTVHKISIMTGLKNYHCVILNWSSQK